MIIDRIHITSFGALREKEIAFSAGLNIIEGENESGKTTVATFIRFVFYGFLDTRDASRYLAYSDGTLSGWLDCTVEGEEGKPVSYRVTRTLDALVADTDVRGIASVLRLPEETPVYTDKIPGEAFFGVGAGVFASTAFVRQATPSSRSASSVHEGTRVRSSTVRSAIDNILFTASESMDAGVALADLSAKRDALYNAETRTGTIYDAERRRAALARKVEEQGAEESELRALRQAISDCESRVRLNRERLHRLTRAREQLATYRTLEAATPPEDLRVKAQAAEKRAEALSSAMFRGGYEPDMDFVTTLHTCASDMREAKTETSSAQKEMDRVDFSARRDNLNETLLRRVERDGGVEALRDKLDKIYSRRAVVTVCGVLFLIFCVFALAITVLLLTLHSAHTQTAIIITAVLAALSGTFFFTRARIEGGLVAMLRRYSCTTEDELENFFEGYILSSDRLHANEQSREEIGRRQSSSSFRYHEAARQAAGLLSKLQPPGTAGISPDRLTCDIVETAAGRVERTVAEIYRQRETAAACRTEIDAYLAKVGVTDEKAVGERRDALRAAFGGRAASEIDDGPILREIEKCEEANRSLEEQIATLRARAKLDGAVNEGDGGLSPLSAEDVDALKAQISALDEALRRDRRTYGALTLAMEHLQGASNRLHDEIAPRLMANAGMLMRVLSDWRYRELGLDEKLHMTYPTPEGDILPIDFLSAGTQDLAYLSLRMALLHMLYPDELPPLLFDEAFATLDDKRLSHMVSLLFSTTGGEDGVLHTGQALVFTCHKRESRAAGEGGARIISLEPLG